MKKAAQQFVLIPLMLLLASSRLSAADGNEMKKLAIAFIANNFELFPDNKFNGPIHRFINSKNSQIFCTERRYNHLDRQREQEAYNIFDTMKSKTYVNNKESKYKIYYPDLAGNEESAAAKGDLIFTLDCHDPFYDKNHYSYVIVSIRTNKNDYKDGEIIYLKFKDKKVINYYFKYWIA